MRSRDSGGASESEIAGVSEHYSSQQRRVRFQRGYGGDEGFFFGFFGAFFRARPGRLELSDSFRALPW